MNFFPGSRQALCRSWKERGYLLCMGPAQRREAFKDMSVIEISRENRANLFHLICHREANHSSSFTMLTSSWLHSKASGQVSSNLCSRYQGKLFKVADGERRWPWCFAYVLSVARTFKSLSKWQAAPSHIMTSLSWSTATGLCNALMEICSVFDWADCCE